MNKNNKNMRLQMIKEQIHELRKKGNWVLLNNKYELIAYSNNKSEIINKSKGNQKIFAPLRKVIVTKEQIQKYELIQEKIMNEVSI